MRWIDDLSGGMPHCKRCRVELAGTEQVCPRCNFDPQQEGYRWAGIGLFVMVASIILAQLSLVTVPATGPYFLVLSILAFLFTLVVFFLAMLATPYRFGGLFDLL